MAIRPNQLPEQSFQERRINMKKGLYTGTILVLVISLSVVVAATSAFAWNQSFHALVAKKCLGLDYRYIASYNARMGSIVPDFFWYLRDAGLIDAEPAEEMHGPTEQPCVIEFPHVTEPGETTYFYQVAWSLLTPWDYRLKYFAKGIRTHVYADIIAHNIDNGYLEGEGQWIDMLASLTGMTEVEDRGVLHLALELAVDSLLIIEYGLKLNDLLFAYYQANLVEQAVVEALGDTPGFDVSQEFKKYLALMRALEKLAALYAPYLIQGEVPEGALSMLAENEILELEPELSEEGLNMYLRVLLILIVYPAEIRDTITADGMDWEDALETAIDFCRDPFICD
jgi:hypothetical protein